MLIAGIGSLTQASSSSSVSPPLPSASAPSGPDTPSIPCKSPCACFVCIYFESICTAGCLSEIRAAFGQPGTQNTGNPACTVVLLNSIFLHFLSLHRKLQQDGLVSRRCSNANRCRTGSGSAGSNRSSVSGGSNEYGEVPDPQVIG